MCCALGQSSDRGAKQHEAVQLHVVRLDLSLWRSQVLACLTRVILCDGQAGEEGGLSPWAEQHVLLLGPSWGQSWGAGRSMDCGAGVPGACSRQGSCAHAGDQARARLQHWAGLWLRGGKEHGCQWVCCGDQLLPGGVSGARTLLTSEGWDQPRTWELVEPEWRVHGAPAQTLGA